MPLFLTRYPGPLAAKPPKHINDPPPYFPVGNGYFSKHAVVFCPQTYRWCAFPKSFILVLCDHNTQFQLKFHWCLASFFIRIFFNRVKRVSSISEQKILIMMCIVYFIFNLSFLLIPMKGANNSGVDCMCLTAMLPNWRRIYRWMTTIQLVPIHLHLKVFLVFILSNLAFPIICPIVATLSGNSGAHRQARFHWSLLKQNRENLADLSLNLDDCSVLLNAAVALLLTLVSR